MLHLDLRSYFPSIDAERVRAMLVRRVPDARLRAVVDRILAGAHGLYDSPRVRRFAGLPPDWPPRGRGLPIGAVTSQLFATHLYLQGFDHWLKRVQKVPGYVRYVDDMFLFGNSRAELRAWRSTVRDYLRDELDLRLKYPNARVLDCRGHLDALGVRIRRCGVEPLPAAWRRFRKMTADWVWSGGNAVDLRAAVASRVGHLMFQ
ncbi:MAG: RNA-directed DNA polymerase [Planctomycetes bacterium]|nr:RNA-directed DNA polymerase [Planctomycetota bacterium]